MILKIPTVAEIMPRLVVYGIDDEVRATARRLQPFVAANTRSILEGSLRSIHEQMPAIRPAVDAYGKALGDALSHHLATLFEARFDEAYLKSLEAALQVEIASTLGVRARLSLCQRLMEPIGREMAKRSLIGRLFGVKPIEIDRAMRLILFDIACAASIAQNEANDAQQQRRAEIEAAAI